MQTRPVTSWPTRTGAISLRTSSRAQCQRPQMRALLFMVITAPRLVPRHCHQRATCVMRDHVGVVGQFEIHMGKVIWSAPRLHRECMPLLGARRVPP